MRKALLSLFAIAAFTSSAAIAAPQQVTIKFNDPIWGTGDSYLAGINASIKYPDRDTWQGVGTGRFVGTASNFANVSPEIFYKNKDEVYMYCFDVYNTILSGETVGYTIDFTGAADRTLEFIDAVNRVLSGDGNPYNPYAWVTPTNSVQASAIQLGLWESLYETSGWNLGLGAFQAKAYDNNTTTFDDAFEQANTFFTFIEAGRKIEQKYTMVLRNPTRQDMITADPPVNAVPIPGTLLLLLPALAGLAIGTRRRRMT